MNKLNIIKNSQSTVNVNLDLLDLTTIRDSLINYIPYVKVNGYFDENQIKYVEELIESMNLGLELLEE